MKTEDSKHRNNVAGGYVGLIFNHCRSFRTRTLPQICKTGLPEKEGEMVDQAVGGFAYFYWEQCLDHNMDTVKNMCQLGNR